MTPALTQLVVWLNGLAGLCATVLLAPVGLLPGWLSLTLVAAASGAAMLLAFKYTSNQRGLQQVRRNIKAELLAIALFRDSVGVSLRCQGRILLGAGRLVWLGAVPTLVMIIPVCLLLAQLRLWYEARPLQVGEETVVTVVVAPGPDGEVPDLQLSPCAAVEAIAGPVRVVPERIVCWNVRAREPGYHALAFQTASETYAKEVAIGTGLLRVSTRRPGWHWADVAVHPGEPPFPAGSRVEAIEIAYPDRDSWVAGTGSWLVYWCGASMAFALLLRPLLKVQL